MIATNRLINTVFLLVFIFMGVFANWIFTLRLPNKVATNFNLAGNPDGFMTLQNHQSFIILSTIFFSFVYGLHGGYIACVVPIAS